MIHSHVLSVYVYIFASKLLCSCSDRSLFEARAHQCISGRHWHNSESNLHGVRVVYVRMRICCRLHVVGCVWGGEGLPNCWGTLSLGSILAALNMHSKLILTFGSVRLNSRVALKSLVILVHSTPLSIRFTKGPSAFSIAIYNSTSPPPPLSCMRTCSRILR